MEIRELIVQVRVRETDNATAKVNIPQEQYWDRQQLVEQLKHEILNYFYERGGL